MELDNTPSKKSLKLDESTSSTTTPKLKMPPPAVPNVQLKGKLNKRVNRSTSAWKTLSLSRKDKVKNSDASSQIFRSPSIYENNHEQQPEQNDENIMNRYANYLSLC